MNAKLVQLLAFVAIKPKAEETRRQITSRFRGAPTGTIENACIDSMEENPALLCVLYFQVAPSSTALVESVAINDAFALTIFHLEILSTVSTIQQPGPEPIACLEAIVDLLLRLVAKREHLRCSVKDELIGAHLLCRALKNTRAGLQLLDGVQYDVFLGANYLHRYGRELVTTRSCKRCSICLSKTQTALSACPAIPTI